MKKKLGEMEWQSELCIAEFDGRRRVLMRVLWVDAKAATFDPKQLVFVQLSGQDHTEGHAVLYFNLDPDMEVETLPTTVSIPFAH